MMELLYSPELGHITLLLMFAVSLAACILAVVHSARAEQVVPLLAKFTLASSGLVLLAVGLLVWAYARSDFSFANVWQNSSSHKPFWFKIAGTWGNHEGSMLLWLSLLGVYGMALVPILRGMAARIVVVALGSYSVVAVCVLAYIIFASSPFLHLVPTPAEGQDLNPVLQDWALIVHPPLLYMGTAGTVIPFVLAIAGAFQPENWRVILPLMQRFALVAWGFLTIGITLGSYWAYYELGWGGWWFWDPVENSSFLPWLMLLGLIHALKLSIKKQEFHYGTLILALLPFMSVSFGTFLVRSGVLNSVHAFAVDPERGLWLLGMFAVSFIVFLSILVVAHISVAGGRWPLASRDGALRAQVLFMGTIFGTVLAGVVYPLVLEAVNGHKISVGQPFYEAVIFPFAMPMLVLMGILPLLRWSGAVLEVGHKMPLVIFGGTILVSLVSYGAIAGFELQAQVFYALGVMVMIAALLEGRVFFTKSLSVWGVRLAHLGVGLAVIGAVMASQGRLEESKALGIGDGLKLGGMQLTLEQLEQRKEPNYLALVAHLKLAEPGHAVEDVVAERRIYMLRQAQTTEVGLATRGLSQVYIAMGEVVDEKHIIIRAQYKPYIMLLWLGAALMGIGGFVAAFAVRLRGRA